MDYHSFSVRCADALAQFLNSVLSSIGGNGTPISTPQAPAAKSQSADTGSHNNQAQNGARIAVGSIPQKNKRKAEDVLARPESKNLKNGVVDGQTSRAAPTTDPRLPKPAPLGATLPSKSTSVIGPNSFKSPSSASTPASKPNIPYRGTSRPNAVTAAAPPAANPAAPTTTVNEATKAPKKGSYAEIMARANATQSKAPVVGIISHKPKDQMPISYKKELKMKKKALKNKKLGIKTSDRPSSSGSMSSSPAPGTTNAKKHPEPTYKGTAKPPKPQPTYKGTMAPTSSAVAKSTRVKPSKSRYDEYAATDEDDLDDIEEDEYGSGEESDDMEAGFSDVEQEESAAARAARKEDEEEAKLEAKLKTEKEERKKRLAEMARKAKPQRY